MAKRRQEARLRNSAAWRAALCLLAVAVGCNSEDVEPSEVAAPEAEIFHDEAQSAGIDFVHFNGMTGEFYMAEVTGAGVALFDYDNDGDLDVYLVQGRILGPGKSIEDALFQPSHPLPLRDRLYRNDLQIGKDGVRSMAFVDVTQESGLDAREYGMGVAAGDYDNDGWIDLYVTNWGANQLWRNRGDGTFEDVTTATGVSDSRWSVPAAFFDYDRDGWLDLYVGNYIAATFENRTLCRDFIGARDYCGPGSFEPEPDRLFRNLGRGRDGKVTFGDVTAAVGIRAGFGGALGVVAADLNADQRTDLYVANDGLPNNLWLQQSDGTFVDEALLAGCSVNGAGRAEASMGVDAGDADRDGDLDLFMAHLTGESNTFFLNNGTAVFEDATVAAGLAAPSRAYTSFGAGFLDYDNDGWLDLIVVSGAVKKIESLARQGDRFPLHQPNQLFRNLGDGRFEEVLGVRELQRSEVSRGAAFGDIDNDGDTDVLIVNNNGPARLLINGVGNRRHWLGVRAVSIEGRRDVHGARIEVQQAGRFSVQLQVRTEGSFASANDPRVLFGLGDETADATVRIHWLDGSIETWDDLSVDRYVTLRQGTGTMATQEGP